MLTATVTLSIITSGLLIFACASARIPVVKLSRDTIERPDHRQRTPRLREPQREIDSFPPSYSTNLGAPAAAPTIVARNPSTNQTMVASEHNAGTHSSQTAPNHVPIAKQSTLGKYGETADIGLNTRNPVILHGLGQGGKSNSLETEVDIDEVGRSLEQEMS